MAKFSGKVGYVIQKESGDNPGIVINNTTEKQYYGDILQDNRRWSSNSDQRNDDLNLSVRISIVADAFMYENFSFMSYVVYMGAKWKITDVSITRPRIILTLGGLYHGQ